MIHFSEKYYFIVFILLAAVILACAGICTKPFLGDEIYHYRFAKDIYQSNSRPIIDSQYDSAAMPTILYTSPPLWNYCLAALWRLTGGISNWSAQIYHVFFYLLILVCTYLIAKEQYSEQTAFLAILMAATIPMIVSFSILLYTDMPETAICMIGIVLIQKRRFLLSGCIWGLALLTKNNAAFFLPAVSLFVLFSGKDRIWKKVLNCLLVSIPPAAFYYLEMRWRAGEFASLPYSIIQGVASSSPSKGFTGISGELRGFLDILHGFYTSRILPNLIGIRAGSCEYLNSYILNCRDIAAYLGIVVVTLLLLYLILRKFERKDGFLIGLIAFYAFCVFLIIGSNTDIRYFMPIVPLLCILAAKSLAGTRNRWVYAILVCGCIGQFTCSVFYVYHHRSIQPSLQEGFDYIRDNTPASALMLYPEPNIQEYAGRKLAWSNLRPPTSLHDIFWSKDLKTFETVLSTNKIDYIVIKKKRCYDDSTVHHTGGYPNSFVHRLQEYECLQLQFDNSEIAVWQVQRQRFTSLSR